MARSRDAAPLRLPLPSEVWASGSGTCAPTAICISREISNRSWIRERRDTGSGRTDDPLIRSTAPRCRHGLMLSRVREQLRRRVLSRPSRRIVPLDCRYKYRSSVAMAPTQLAGTYADITERKESERALRDVTDVLARRKRDFGSGRVERVTGARPTSRSPPSSPTSPPASMDRERHIDHRSRTCALRCAKGGPECQSDCRPDAGWRLRISPPSPDRSISDL
jgi:hypothetical protein